MPAHIAPGILLATPWLPDPVFARTVVWIVEHDERGAFGLILNRPSLVPLDEAMHKSGLSWPTPTEHVVWDGGPVRPELHEPEGFVLHHPSSPDPGDPEAAHAFTPGFRLYPFPPEPRTLTSLREEPPERLRFFMGYAAWTPGQLENEVLQNAWLLLPPDPVLVFHTPPEVMWESGFHLLGVEPSAIVPGHGLH